MKATTKSQILQLAASVLVLSTMSAAAAIRYVNVNGAGPASPYTNWTTAATTIQDAVDAAVSGEQILVTNGVYQTGGRVVFGAMTNRVAVDKAVTVQSVNGAAVTVIRGYQVTGTTNGDGAIRCVYLSTGAALVGFTLTNGATRSSGDERERNGGGVWCESASAVVSNCVLTGNSAGSGGGGAYDGTLNNCTLTGNSAYYGGGASYQSGGGVHLNNCSLTANSAYDRGGGVSGGTLNNCTLTCNSAQESGGGADNSALNNCILYYNSARIGENYAGYSLNYSCTTPLPLGGVGNISAEPQLTDLSHLSAGSPCRGAGSAAYAIGQDIDGEPWANPPSIGCDEYHPGASIGPLSVSIQAAYTNVTVGFAVNFTAAIDGGAIANRWGFGDGTVVSNRPYASHTWAVEGNYSVVFQAYNDTNPGGISATVTVQVVAQPVHYVALGSANPVAPYTSWVTAADSIQAAVDAASTAGALVLVANGVYQTGGRVVVEGGYGAIANRVAVNKPVTIQSVNGAAGTVIQGSQLMRCIYLSSSAALVGFTLTNGKALDGGGVWCESASAVVSNCTLSGNSALQGGGASGGALYYCTISGNSCDNVDGNGGGVAGSTLYNCTLTHNSASLGGGAAGGTLNNCTLTDNSANEGGGAYGGTLNNCALSGNSASYDGGGAYVCTLNNCTLTGNSADEGGGAGGGTLHNCVLYYNSAPAGANYSGSVLSYSCTTPLPPDGVANISAEPQLADFSHLSAGSPCRGAGSAAYAAGLDIDGEPFANPPSIGCDEYQRGAVTGPISVSIEAAYTVVTVGFALNFTAAIDGLATAIRWEFADGTMVSNRPYASHSWAVAGDYSVVFQAFNDTNPGGLSATVAVHVVEQPVHYVAVGSANPVAPYTSWATAANNIQDAVDAASEAGALVLVTDGVYQTGQRQVTDRDGFVAVPNRVAVTKPIIVRSVNGAMATIINGQGAVHCVYLSSGAAIVGFTLANGAAVLKCQGNSCTSDTGGGVWCESGRLLVADCILIGNLGGYGGGADGVTLSNCTLTGNSAFGGGGAIGCTLLNCTLAGNQATTDAGGGAEGCLLYNCKLTGNSAIYGGGTAYGTLYNCTLAGNSATSDGGGADGGTLNNCIAYYNSAPIGDNCSSFSTLSYSCTTPLPADGMGNITNAPLFVDYAGGNLRLQSNSPCINAGSNITAPAGPDLDGNPRIAGATVDIGAYEFQAPQSLISYAWLQQYGLPTDGSADAADPDGDGMNNWQEWRCGTSPTDASSALRLLSAQRTGTNITVTWQSVAGVNYFLERSTDLAVPSSFTPLATSILGQPGTTSYIDTNAAVNGPRFYRVGVGH